jgi:hypothetical protein
VNSHSFLISVIRPLDLTITTRVKSLSSSDVREALKNQFKLLQTRGFKITAVHTDGGFSSLTDYLASKGATHEIVAAGSHVAVVENKIRNLKNRIRSIIFSLKYLVPNSIIPYLVSFATRAINMSISKNSINSTTPLENFMGRKTNYNIDLRVYFGQYVQVHHPNVNNSMEARTSGAIALMSTNNSRGTVVFYDLNTLKTVHRDHWTEVPLTQEIIDRMNLIAMKEKIQPYETLTVTRGRDREIVSMNNQDNETIPLPQQPNQTMIPSQERVEINLEQEIEDDSDDDSDYFPSDDEDVEWDPDTEDESTSPQQPIQAIETAHTEDQPQVDEQRYPTRTNRGRHTAFLGFHTSIEKALQSYGEKGKAAIQLELKHMHDKGVFLPINPLELDEQELNKCIPSFAFLKQKYRADGSEDKIKARLVAGGHRQDKTLYQDVSSPTANITHILTEAVIASGQLCQIATIDVGSAYLNAPMEGERVLMKLNRSLSSMMVELYPEYSQYVHPISGIIVVKLLKALYGCVQSALLWYKHLRNTLEEIGFRANEYDQCIFSKGVGNNRCTIIVYVDDLMVICKCEEEITEVIQRLTDKYKEINVNRGNQHSYLGMNFKFRNKQVEITMEGYIQSILNAHKIDGKASSPAAPDFFEAVNQERLPIASQKQMHTSVAQLLYLGTRVRPDILLCVNYLTTRVNKFTTDDQKKITRCLKYLNATKHLGLTLRLSETHNLQLMTHADASFGIHPDGRSQTAIVSTLGSGAIFSTTQKQKITAKSSSEAELIAASDAAGESIGLRNYLLSRSYNANPVILGQDNLSTKHILEKGIKSARRVKHLNIRYFFVQDYINDQQLSVKYVKTNDMIADVLTKPLQGEQFVRLRDALLGNIPERTYD